MMNDRTCGSVDDPHSAPLHYYPNQTAPQVPTSHSGYVMQPMQPYVVFNAQQRTISVVTSFMLPTYPPNLIQHGMYTLCVPDVAPSTHTPTYMHGTGFTPAASQQFASEFFASLSADMASQRRPTDTTPSTTTSSASMSPSRR